MRWKFRNNDYYIIFSNQVHSKLDLQDVQSKNDRMIQDIEADKATALREAEKQKTMLLQYFDYVKLRNNEILIGLEDKQEDERFIQNQLNNYAHLIESVSMSYEMMMDRTPAYRV